MNASDGGRHSATEPPATQAGGPELPLLLVDQGAQRGPVDRTVEPEADVRVGTGEQYVAHPVVRRLGLGGTRN